MTAEHALGHEGEEYSNLEEPIARFTLAATQCELCESKALSCYLAPDKARCVPCLLHNHECSLATTEVVNLSTLYECNNNHLGIPFVDDNVCKEQEVLAEKKRLAPKSRSNGVSATVRFDDAPGSTKRNGIRFPRDAVMVLRHWFDANTDHPYPTAEQKADLEQRTELKPSQISDWLANARRRQKGKPWSDFFVEPWLIFCRKIYVPVPSCTSDLPKLSSCS